MSAGGILGQNVLNGRGRIGTQILSCGFHLKHTAFFPPVLFYKDDFGRSFWDGLEDSSRRSKFNDVLKIYCR